MTPSNCLKVAVVFFLCQLHGSYHDHPLASIIFEPQLELSLHFTYPSDFRVVDEGLARGRAGRGLAGGAEFQTLDDLRTAPESDKKPPTSL
jgi:hypothetical protein